METVCKECNRTFADDGVLHRHLRGHKMAQPVYYQKHYPRYDKYDGSIILFKSKEFYFTADFNTRGNLSKWLASASREDARLYLTDWFQKRKARKNLVYTPTQVELRSLPVPGMKYLIDLFGDYYQFAEQLGFVNKFKNFSDWQPIKFNRGHKIYIDTREKNLLKFKTVSTEKKKLDYGDYCLSDGAWTGNTFIERKSLTDFIGTLSFGLERFKREIIRAQEAQAYLVVLVEENLANCLDFKRLPSLPSRIQIPPEYIFRNVREVIQSFSHVQFLFVDSHLASAEMVERLFSYGKKVKSVDLQFLHDSSQL